MNSTQFPRRAGILLPISGLPSPYGIGTMGKQARAFADDLKKAGQSYWQVLPIGPTSYGDSPYQSFSAFAGNPYFIDLDTLADEGLIQKKKLYTIPWCGNLAYVDYDRQWNYRYPILREAFSAFDTTEKAYVSFKRKEASWLKDYALFMACKKEFNNKSWQEWPEAIRLRKPAAVKKYTAELKDEIEFWCFLQYKFDCQWNALKAYVNAQGVAIIGDIPIYVAADSCDVWASPEEFQLDEMRKPVNVAGCPPDAFSADGQMWGNPLYDWKHMAETDFSWWRKRMASVVNRYDVVRIDHFIGIVRYFCIPAGKTPKEGWYEKGPGKALLTAINEVCEGKTRIIAEDLGVVTDEVRALLAESGYPGMKVLEFAFGGGADNVYLPHHHIKNCVLYLGTHDNDTLDGYLATAGDAVIKSIENYYDVSGREAIRKSLMRSLYMSVADTVILQMQDILEKGSEARMNYPSTAGTNWKWRMLPGEFTRDKIRWLRDQSERYSRLAPEPEKTEGKKRKTK